jgi:hypothetical protein
MVVIESTETEVVVGEGEAVEVVVQGGDTDVDVSGFAPDALFLRGRAIGATAPADGEVYAWDEGLDAWLPTTMAADFSDLTGQLANSQVPVGEITLDRLAEDVYTEAEVDALLAGLTVSWSDIDSFAGSSLAQLATRSYTDLQNIPATFAPAAHTHPWSDLNDFAGSSLADLETADAADLSGTLHSDRLTGAYTGVTGLGTLASTLTMAAALTTDVAWQARLTTDTQPRLRATVGGVLEFGPGGTSVPDVTIERSTLDGVVSTRARTAFRAGDSVLFRDSTVLGGAFTDNVFQIAASMPAAPPSQTNFVRWIFTTAGNTANQILGHRFQMSPGYTGSSPVRALQWDVSVAGTGSNLQLSALAAPDGNGGVAGFSWGTTTGLNYGSMAEARNGNLNVGQIGKATGAKNGAVNIGVLGVALNTGTTPTHVGGFFGLRNSTPTWASAALVADNGSTTDPILLLRDNGVTVVTVADGGLVTLAGALATSASTTVRAGLNVPPGAAPDSPVNGDLWHVAASGWFGQRGGVTEQFLTDVSGIAWSQITDFTGSSLAQLATRSAADLSSGKLAYARLPLGDGEWAYGNASNNNLIFRSTAGIARVYVHGTPSVGGSVFGVGGQPLDDSGIESLGSGSATILPARMRLRSGANAGDWATGPSNPWGELDFYSDDATLGPGSRAAVTVHMEAASGGPVGMALWVGPGAGRTLFATLHSDLTMGLEGALEIAGNVGFYGQAATAKPTGVAETAEAIHAALVTLNLIAA